MERYERTLLLVLIGLGIASCIRAPFPSQMYLQHVPTVLGILALTVVARRRALSRVAFTCIVLFVLLHVLGARYIYSYVPYDEWSQKILGVTLTSRFGWRRNHYDRLVHFAFGLLAVHPVREVMTKRFKVPSGFAWYASVEFVLAISVVYELFEWGLTMVLSPHDAGAYNGEQGDIWDAHRDMLAAFIGALIAVTIGNLTTRRTKAAA